ncbi:MAG TPA: esterase-like activity of phytase family protein, partial [Rhizobacter sp.]|nr:esterase-like activity of phytase family protein [Rhizobacter sp.]
QLFDAAGAPVAGSVEDCTVDAAGAIVTTVSGCPAGAVAARLVRGADSERPTRLWLIKFNKKLAEFAVPAAP